MFLRLLLLVTILQCGWAAICPTFYTDGGDGYCYRAYNTPTTRGNAAKQCNKDGGLLASQITNSYKNSNLRNFGKTNNITSTWLGIVCQASSYKSCQTDEFNSTLTYWNFAAGSPNIVTGPFVYLDVSNGMWYSAGLSNRSFVCQTSKGSPSVYCDSGYSLNTTFKKCYGLISAMNQTAQINKCKADGGNLASIHSAEENTLVYNLTKNAYTRIGLVLSGTNSLSCTDGSKYNYSNFGELNGGLGSCVSISKNNELVKAGQWISSRCDTAVAGICKKDEMYKYSPISPEIVPANCTGTTYLTNSGTLYSPGYPSGYIKRICSYVLSVPSGVVSITFPEFNLDNYGSKVYLYNDITDSVPFKKLDLTSGLGKTFNSTGPYMKVIFDGNIIATRTWMAYFY